MYYVIIQADNLVNPLSYGCNDIDYKQGMEIVI